MVLTLQEWEAVRLSLSIAGWAVVLTLPVATALAVLLVRGRFPGRALLDGVVHLPLVLPPVVTGYLLLVLFGRAGPLGQVLWNWFGVRLVFTTEGAVLATGVMISPLMVRAIRLALEGVDGGLEDAARTLGAGRLDCFFNVTLPLMLPGIVAGTIVAFAAALGEFGAIITFVSNIPGETQTLPLAIYTATQSVGGDEAAARLVVMAAILAFSGLLMSEIAARRVNRLLGRR